MPGKKVILIDGNSLLYRAFYALPTSLATKTGQVTNAVYGFATMLLKLVDERHPEHIIVAFDKGKITFRHSILESYKANRPKMPEELFSQLPIIRELLEAMDIPALELEGFEADDILATLATKAEAEGFDVDIVTGDKDALQLVSDKTSVLTTKKGITDINTFRSEDVIEKYGVAPEGIIDWLALRGDASDNIPGVPGIGEKTATELLRVHKNVENILAHLDDLKSAKIRNAIEENIEALKTAKQLVTLIKDVAIDIDWEHARLQEWDESKLGPLLRALEFNSLHDRLFISKTSQPSLFDIADETPRPKNLPNHEDFKELLNKAEEAGYIAVDLAVSNADKLYLAFAMDGIAYSTEVEGKLIESLNAILACKATKIVHDNKRMYRECNRSGLSWTGNKFDVMLAAYLDEPANGRYGLADLSLRYLQNSSDEAGIAERLGSSVLAIEALHPILRGAIELQDARELLDKVELPLSEVLAEMELTGVGIDIEYLEKLGKELSKELTQIAADIFELAGSELNINSPQQLAELLFSKLGLKGKKKTKTGYSTDISVLVEMEKEHPIIPKIIRWRELSKLRSTYIYALPGLVDPKDKRLHTTFNQVGTATGRLASSNPNLQNIPVRTDLGLRVRKAFIAAPGERLITADYSQIELRILAHLSKDEMLINSFARGEDIHARTAAEVFSVPLDEVNREQRRLAKAINFGIVYGMSQYGLARQIDVKAEEAQAYIDKYFNTHKGVREFIDDIVLQAEKDGYVATILNRRRHIPELKSANPRVRQLGERLAVNSPLQGSAADIIKLAMIAIAEALEITGAKASMILQIHDELMFSVPNDEVDAIRALVIDKMENAYPLDVHLKVDVSVVGNWGEAKV